MIDHIGLQVSDFAKSKRFYAAALAPLGYKALMEFGDEGQSRVVWPVVVERHQDLHRPGRATA